MVVRNGAYNAGSARSTSASLCLMKASISVIMLLEVLSPMCKALQPHSLTSRKYWNVMFVTHLVMVEVRSASRVLARTAAILVWVTIVMLSQSDSRQ